MNTIQIYKGTSKTIPLSIEKDGVPFDITGYTATLTIKENLNDTDAQAILIQEVTNHVDPTEGKTAFSITIAESETFPSGTAYYQIQISEGVILLVVVAGEFLIQEKLKD